MVGTGVTCVYFPNIELFDIWSELIKELSGSEIGMQFEQLPIYFFLSF